VEQESVLTGPRTATLAGYIADQDLSTRKGVAAAVQDLADLRIPFFAQGLALFATAASTGALEMSTRIRTVLTSRLMLPTRSTDTHAGDV
jgi:hypothetical protein